MDQTMDEPVWLRLGWGGDSTPRASCRNRLVVFRNYEGPPIAVVVGMLGPTFRQIAVADVDGGVFCLFLVYFVKHYCASEHESAGRHGFEFAGARIADFVHEVDEVIRGTGEDADRYFVALHANYPDAVSQSSAPSDPHGLIKTRGD